MLEVRPKRKKIYVMLKYWAKMSWKKYIWFPMLKTNKFYMKYFEGIKYSEICRFRVTRKQETLTFVKVLFGCLEGVVALWAQSGKTARNKVMETAIESIEDGR